MTVDTIGYVRVSTEQQAGEQKTSLADQRRAITELAKRMGRVLSPSMIFEDAGVSGATAEGRPAFMALLSYCQANPRPAKSLGLIVILNDSRLGRFTHLDEAGHWRFTLEKLGWPVRFAEGDDVENPMARGVIRFLGSAQATEYRLNLKRNALRAARSHAQLGQWQQEAPFGFRRLATRLDGAQRVMEIGQRKSADEVARLTPGPQEEQDAVRWLFETYAKGGVSLQDLTVEMIKRFPIKRWSKQVCRAILHNPAYCGDVVWCRRVTDKAERQIRKVRDRSEWVIVQDAHPVIVSREVFELVQQRMASNKRETTATAGGYPLAGLIRCAQCGNHFTGGGGKKGPPGDVDRYRFYRDTGNTKRIPECGKPMLTLRKSWLEREIVEAIIEQSSHPSTREAFAKKVRDITITSTGAKERGRGLSSERERVVASRARLLSAIASGTVTETEAAATMAELRARITTIETELQALQFASQRRRSINAELLQAQTVAKDYANQIRRLSGHNLRAVVAPWIADARVDKERRVLILRLWLAAGLGEIMRLGRWQEQSTQDKATLRRLTTRRRIPIPRQQVQLTRWCRSRARVHA